MNNISTKLMITIGVGMTIAACVALGSGWFFTNNNGTEVDPQPIEPKKVYTMLFIGESGVGKSTTISSIENYLKYKTFDEAKENLNNLTSRIPLQFNVYREDADPKVVFEDATGNNVDSFNENFNNDSCTVTQQPKIYSFEYNDAIFRIIDTPGLLDTRGYQQDLINKGLIRNILQEEKEIHAICIVVRSNESRIRPEFERSMRELLSLFPTTAFKNIFFFFTFTSETFFVMRDYLNTLREWQRRMEGVYGKAFRIADSTCCMDSESYKYLIAKKNGILYSDRPESSFEDSWNNSAQLTIRFLESLKKIEPVSVLPMSD